MAHYMKWRDPKTGRLHPVYTNHTLGHPGRELPLRTSDYQRSELRETRKGTVGNPWGRLGGEQDTYAGSDGDGE